VNDLGSSVTCLPG